MDPFVSKWSSATVGSWLVQLGFSQYEKKFRENDINGEVLLYADQEMLKELSVKSVGHRIALLRAIHKLKLQSGDENIPTVFELDANGNIKGATSVDGSKYRDYEIAELARKVEILGREFEKVKQSSSNALSKHISNAHDLPLLENTNTFSSMKDISKTTEMVIKVYGHKLLNHENESYKTVKVSTHDSCSKVLPKVMKKWKINDDWKKYALFVVFKGKGIFFILISETCLSYNDCPLFVMMQLKDEKETPVFVLKSIRATDSLYENRLSSSSQKILSQQNSSQKKPNNNEVFPLNDASSDTAVAVYEYKAERDDEFDVNIGDTFVIRDKNTTGWWVVEKDGKTGWVPSGCLITEDGMEVNNDEVSNVGYALFDYDAIGVNELSIKKGDRLNIHKKYQHWLLVACNGIQGWVPSCYVSSIDPETKQENIEKNDNGNMVRSNILDFNKYSSGVRMSTSGLSVETTHVKLKPAEIEMSKILASFNEKINILKQQFDNGSGVENASVNNNTESIDFRNVLMEAVEIVTEFMMSDSVFSQDLITSNNLQTFKSLITQFPLKLVLNFRSDLENLLVQYRGISLAAVSSSIHSDAPLDYILGDNEKDTAFFFVIEKFFKFFIELIIKMTHSFVTEISSGSSLETKNADVNKRKSLSHTILSKETIGKSMNQAFENFNSPRATRTHHRESEIPKNFQKKSEVFSRQDIYYIIPYHELLRRKDDLDKLNLEVGFILIQKYLSDDDCVEFLGCTKKEIESMSIWQLNQRKKRANLL